MTSIRKAKKARKRLYKKLAEALVSYHPIFKKPVEFPLSILTEDKKEGLGSGKYFWNFPPVMKYTPSENMRQVMDEAKSSWNIIDENGRRICKRKQK